MFQKSIFIIVILTIVLCPVLILAEDELEFDPGGILLEKSRLGTEDPASIAYAVINWALIFLGIITLTLVIAAGFIWMFAAGEEEKIKKAQDILKGALIGLVIILASYGIASYVFNRLAEITSETEPSVFDQVDPGEIEIGEDVHVD